jgi:hypothetical protein
LDFEALSNAPALRDDKTDPDILTILPNYRAAN